LSQAISKQTLLKEGKNTQKRVRHISKNSIMQSRVWKRRKSWQQSRNYCRSCLQNHSIENPKHKYLVGPAFEKLFAVAKRVLPEGFTAAIFKRYYGL